MIDISGKNIGRFKKAKTIAQDRRFLMLDISSKSYICN